MVGQSRILILLLVVIGMAACSGDNTGVEVIPEPGIEVTPEPIEEVIPEEEPDFRHFGTLESWGAEDGFINVAKDNAGDCVDPLLLIPDEDPFSFGDMKKITTADSPVRGPECRDDDNEGSLTEAECVSETNLGGTFLYCKEGNEGYCHERARTDDKIDYCVIIPRDTSLIISTGFTNFYSNLFKKNSFYLNTKGELRSYGNKRSFLMVQTHIEYSGYQEVNAVAGKLYGKYNPDSEEYKDRKRLWDECGVGTDPQIGSEKEDAWGEFGINGEWREENGEVCVILDTLPGADVKCVSENKLCELFDEG